MEGWRATQESVMKSILCITPHLCNMHPSILYTTNLVQGEPLEILVWKTFCSHKYERMETGKKKNDGDWVGLLVPLAWLNDSFAAAQNYESFLPFRTSLIARNNADGLAPRTCSVCFTFTTTNRVPWTFAEAKRRWAKRRPRSKFGDHTARPNNRSQCMNLNGHHLGLILPMIQN